MVPALRKCRGGTADLSNAPACGDLPTAQQRLIEQLQQQLANQGASGTLSPPDASGDINAQAASAVAKAAAAKTAELQKQVEKLQQKNRQLTDAAAALQAKGACRNFVTVCCTPRLSRCAPLLCAAADTAATERDACLASLARAESESATVRLSSPTRHASVRLR